METIMMSQNSVLKLDTPVGVIAVDHPLATRVFARHDIDFCCGGGKPLAEVCDKLGLDAAAVLSEIRREVETTNEPERRWDECPLEDLIDHILDAYHRPLDEELPRLEAMARKVNDAHGEKDPERLAEILSVFVALKAELEAHMMKEERILFPMIRRGRGAMADETVSAMVHEHDSAGDALRRLRELTDDHRPPEGACTTWRALWHGLAALEVAMHEHIHLENNILFPRALAGAAPVA
ncbi:MAG: iron-sulfur cluster repair di-iron protein [Phycisphaerae bacterium]|nr:iron-sulfur cluster repair di-iron protein [Phycisphaerae bacterium]